MATLAPLIAVVGCDGSGKSKLAADLLAHIKQSKRAEAGYLGLGSGAMGNRIKAWPIIGPAFEAILAGKAARARDPNDRIPGPLTALVLYRLSLKRKAKFDRLLSLRKAGTIVVTDRYPQVEVPGYYDGPGLSAARAEGRFTKWLATRERAIYDEMASYVPNLVIRLNIDADTAMSRKPDHARDLIESKVAATPLLTFNNAPMIDLDATMLYAEELALAIAAVDKALQ